MDEQLLELIQYAEQLKSSGAKVADVNEMISRVTGGRFDSIATLRDAVSADQAAQQEQESSLPKGATDLYEYVRNLRDRGAKMEDLNKVIRESSKGSDGKPLFGGYVSLENAVVGEVGVTPEERRIAEIAGGEGLRLGAPEAFARNAVDVATLGFADEIGGAMRAGLALVPGGESPGEVYTRERDEMRAKLEQAQIQNPVASGLGVGVGAAIPTGGGLNILRAGRIATKAKTANRVIRGAKNIGRGSAVGGAGGFAGGFGSADTDLKGRVEAGVDAGKIGAALGGLFNVGAAGAGGLSRVATKGRRASAKAAREAEEAAYAVKKAAKDPGAKAAGRLREIRAPNEARRMNSVMDDLERKWSREGTKKWHFGTRDMDEIAELGPVEATNRRLDRFRERAAAFEEEELFNRLEREGLNIERASARVRFGGKETTFHSDLEKKGWQRGKPSSGLDLHGGGQELTDVNLRRANQRKVIAEGKRTWSSMRSAEEVEANLEQLRLNVKSARDRLKHKSSNKYKQSMGIDPADERTINNDWQREVRGAEANLADAQQAVLQYRNAALEKLQTQLDGPRRKDALDAALSQEGLKKLKALFGEDTRGFNSLVSDLLRQRRAIMLREGGKTAVKVGAAAAPTGAVGYGLFSLFN